jgi:hypothetical protein
MGVADPLSLQGLRQLKRAESRQLLQECQESERRVGRPPEVPVTGEAGFRQGSILYAAW